jgi:23S rRNA A1618 N6-methylase RlmF
MHPRNRYYLQRPDFAKLGAKYPELGKYLCINAYGSAQLKWDDPKAMVELCRALLSEDFGVQWSMPLHALCPTVPSRLNYLLWIEDLLALSSHHPSSAPNNCDQQIVGIDIGTGASCIYPLLGVAELGWRFIATEVDPESARSARENVALNAWQDRIDVREVMPATSEITTDAGSADASNVAPILDGLLQPMERAHFCMCNPPFFDMDEIPRNNLAIRPHERCAATMNEQCTPGGEVGFIRRMIADSLALRERIGWYTSLIGRKSSLPLVLRHLRNSGAMHVRTTQIVQGTQWRWAVAWSFVADAAPLLQPPAGAVVKEFEVCLNPDEAWRRAVECLRQSGVHIEPDEYAQTAAFQNLPSKGTAADESAASTASNTLSLRGRVEVGRVQALELPHVRTDGRQKRPRHGAEAVPHVKEGSPLTPPECAFLFRVELFRCPVRQHGSSDAAGTSAKDNGEGIWLRLRLTLEASTKGEASAAFWRFADQLRNDVARDTRKWRRRSQGEHYLQKTTEAQHETEFLPESDPIDQAMQ